MKPIMHCSEPFLVSGSIVQFMPHDYRIAENIGVNIFGELLFVAANLQICSSSSVVANGLNLNFGGNLIWWFIQKSPFRLYGI